MLERRSALATLPVQSAAGQPLTLAERRPASVCQVQAWPETSGSVERAIGEVIGGAFPPVGASTSTRGIAVLGLGPGRFLVWGAQPNLAARLAGALGAAEASVTEISHGRAQMVLQGDSASAVLAKGAAIDFDPAAFPVGRVAQTAIHHIDVTIRRVALDGYELIVLRGFAEDFCEWLLDAGLEFGIAFTGSADQPG